MATHELITQFLPLLALFLVVLLALAWPLGKLLARIGAADIKPGAVPGLGWLGGIERAMLRAAGPAASAAQGWKAYALALIAFNAVGVVFVYGLQRLQGWLPLNPEGMAGVSPDSSFNTAVSFVANTNWQGYSGEQTMSILTQMVGLAGQNFFSAATGIAVAFALIRGFAARSAGAIGNFWVDVTRSTLYVLLPLSVILAVFLAGQGVVQNLSPHVRSADDRAGRLHAAGHRWPGGSRDARRDAGDSDGARRLAGSHQDAGHEWRWLLQRQLGAPV